VRRAAVGADIGLSINPRSEIRIGYEAGKLSAKVRVGDPFLPELNGKFSEASFRWAYDGQDDPIVPTRGLNAVFTARRIFSTPSDVDDFNQAELLSSYFVPVNGRGSAFGYFSGGTTFDKAAPQEQVFTLGGPLRLGAYHKDEFVADNYFVIGGGYLRHVGTLPSLLGDKIYAGVWYEFGGIYQKGLPAQYLSDISSGVILKTKFGPIALGGSFGERKRGRIYFSVGRFF
jgi:NTE family protein